MTAKEALKISGRNLQNIRKAKGFSIPALAILSQVDQAVIKGIEAGNFDDVMPDDVFELAAALNVDLREILVDPTAHH
jgi:transcriptional regulator with XRE-family HTH domain